MKILFLSLLLFLVANHCQAQHPHAVFDGHAAILKKAKTMVLYEIDKTANIGEESAQDTSRKTFLGYQILRTQTLEGKPLHDLGKALLNEKNYVLEAKKSCPMTATYALLVSNKENQSFSILFSDKTCQKAVIHCSEKDFAIKYIDLTEDNEILTLLGGLLNP